MLAGSREVLAAHRPMLGTARHVAGVTRSGAHDGEWTQA
ncbi:hypothetical protein SCE1572_35115 [Sorangium cellulosum So0157-2]|uniref:Uncharacterized protein n=1 Tax=Sorangium cellulosum So0157-2 TaxID=1254432 RepID=S4Y8S5_SORCE|nr:hypothetical protein SCE1572_35115 [Sorangium cellulosum So0157-2]